MIIEKINIRSFGLLKDTTLEFSETVNVIEGQNEAGKSTIAAFLKYMLYGFDGSDPQEAAAERRKRINWDTGTAEGSMTVRVKDKRYLITRSTVRVEGGDKPTYKEDCSIVDLESGTPAFGKLPAGEVFFLVNKELYENTAFVGEIGDIRYSEDTVKESIENILFSGSEKMNNERAMGKLRGKMDVLLHNGDVGGAIVDLTRKQEDLEEQLHRSDEDNKEILAKEAELHEIKAEKQKTEEKLANFTDLDACYKNVMLIQTFDQLHDLEKTADEKTEEYNAFLEENTRNSFAPTHEYLTDLAVARRGVNDAYLAVSEAEEAYNKEKNAVGITGEIEGLIERCDELGGEEQIRKDANFNFMRGLLFAGTAILSGLAAIAALILLLSPIGNVVANVFFGILCGCALVGGATLGIFAKKRFDRLSDSEKRFETETKKDLFGKLALIAQARNKRDGMLRATENARRAFESSKNNYEKAKAELSRVILMWEYETPTTELESFLDGLEGRVGDFLAKKEELLEQKTTLDVTVKEIRRTLSDKSEIDIRAQVPPIKRKALSGVNHDEIINGINECTAQIADQERRAYRVENELAQLKLRATDPGELYAKIQQLEAQISELRARHRAYFLALRTLEGASDALRAEISPRLGDFSTSLMSVMTDKKYTGFSVDDDLGVTFKAQTGDKKEVDFLSGGTRDLTYIAVRMALVDMLYSEKPALCFDESFARQDNLRARSMMKAITRLAKDGYQSFIFTCRNRETALAGDMKCRAGIFKLSVGDEETA